MSIFSRSLVLPCTLLLVGCFPDPYDHANPLDPDYDGVALDTDGDGVIDDEDCGPEDHTIYPGAPEVPYDEIDQDCDLSDVTDVDGDGVDGGEDGEDCDDTDVDIYPGAEEIPYDGIDQDCQDGDLVDVDEDGEDSEEAGGPDCDDTDPDINTDADEIAYDDIDQDCNGEDLADLDGDGEDGEEGGGPDCDDDNPDINTDATEIPYNGIDDDCRSGDQVDVDKDNFDAEEVGGTDCDDSDPFVNPLATEQIGDGEDDNCNGLIDEDVTNYDDDGDGYCEGETCVDGSQPGDCDDDDPDRNPATQEEQDGVDNNCNGEIDEGLGGPDNDDDGYCAEESCSPGGEIDCDDTNPAINPGATEVCNAGDAVDENCDGDVTVGDQDGTGGDDCDDHDGDGFIEAPETGPADCDDDRDVTYPGATEVADTLDNDCDGTVDEGTDNFDDDGDTFSENQGDCDDTNQAINPSASEVCDSLDNNCNKETDEGDGDGDGTSDCRDDDSDGFSEAEGDCKDQNNLVYPGADEQLDGLDQDCSGKADDGVPFSTALSFSESLDRVGDTLATGDYDDDGLVDILVRVTSAQSASAERVVLNLGSERGTTRGLTTAVEIDAGDGSGIGTSMALADLNDDGRDDIVVGVPGQEMVCVFFAQKVSSGSEVAAYSLGDADVCLESESSDSGVGDDHRLAAGDITGDGIDDLVIGAPTEGGLVNGGRPAADGGRVYVFLGGSSFEDLGSAASLASADVIFGGQEGELVGSAVAIPGDLDDSRVDDLTFTADFQDTGWSVVVAYGGSDLEPVTGGVVRDPAQGTTWVVTAKDTINYVATVGDVTGDGLADLMFQAGNGETERIYGLNGGDSAFYPNLSGAYATVELAQSDALLVSGSMDVDLGTSIAGYRVSSSFYVAISDNQGPSSGAFAGRGRVLLFTGPDLFDSRSAPQEPDDAAAAWWSGPSTASEAGTAMVSFPADSASTDEVLMVSAPGVPSGPLYYL